MAINGKSHIPPPQANPGNTVTLPKSTDLTAAIIVIDERGLVHLKGHTKVNIIVVVTLDTAGTGAELQARRSEGK